MLTKAVITGATSGIGFELAKALTHSGREVLALGRNTEQLKKLASEFGCHTLCVDIRDDKAVIPEMLSFKPDILINNAGIGHGIDGLDGLDVSLIQEAIDINVSSPIKLTAALLESMKEQARGHIVNIGSVAGLHTLYSSLYGATKSAIHLFSQNLRAELHGTPIRVTEICPGRVSTGFFQAAIGNEERLKVLGHSGIKELTPTDIADAVLYALSAPAHVNITTIEIMPVDQAVGGMKLNRT
ncbi:MAG: SDR family NAD(P)-dependent oxidoreductase [Alphaproteobacteria bacterium]|jgi:3-hydroxy acid dehydrogenase/malonic semialdehyde reductase|nr:SDR family NAD(P)-dependent oxidoreductase [Alphaproteobacteria bacterium]